MPRISPRKRTQFKLPVLAIIIRGKGADKEVLLIQRYNPKKKYSHMKWAFPGGQMEFGEHPTKTVVREVMEETNIKIDPVNHGLFVQNHVYENEGIHVLALCYPSVYVDGEPRPSKGHGTNDVKWFSVNKIDYKLCLPQEETILKKALEYI